MILHHSEGINLIHHVFLDRELIDDLVFDARPCHHVMYQEMDLKVPALQVTKDSGGVDNQ